MKRKIKNKLFHDKHCRKLTKGTCQKIRYHRRIVPSESLYKRVVAPSELSVFEATSITLSFFEKVIKTISECTSKNTIYFDLSKIEKVSPDAIIYLIAIIKNSKRLRLHRVNCVGNLPKEESARNVFQQVGFLQHVDSSINNVKSDKNYMKIESGQDANGELASAFCSFVLRSQKDSDTKNTKQLYRMIVELMTNTYQHAYKGSIYGTSSVMISNWYIFAEQLSDSVQFVFLDTGEGIPRTVAKRILERITDWIVSNDTDYLASALTGDYPRSETGHIYRGKGLPGIYEDCKTGKIKDLKIISCKAICKVSPNADIQLESLNSPFEGTLFSWRMSTTNKGGQI